MSSSRETARSIITLTHLVLGTFLLLTTHGKTNDYVIIFFGFPLQSFLFIIYLPTVYILSYFYPDKMLPLFPPWLAVIVIVTIWVGNSYLVGYIASRCLFRGKQK